MPSAENKKIIESVCDQLIIIPIYKSLWKKYKKTFLSFFVSFAPAEISTYTNYDNLRQNIKNFNPSILWLETYAPGLPALKIANKLSLPLVYRSHNIEYHYAQAIKECITQKSLKNSIYLWFKTFNLENFEKKLINESQVIYDISIDDLNFWKNLYPQKNIIWLPPLAKDTHLGKLPPMKNKSIDFLFVGNLFTKNNTLALNWMIEEVMPLVHQKLPSALFHIVGSTPSKEFLSYLQSFDYIKLDIDVETIEPYMKAAKVIVNPALKGSGITIKTIDGLQSSVNWVGTKQAFKGLPNNFYALLHPAENAQEFAEQMIYFHSNPDQYPQVEITKLCKQYFDILPKQILSELFNKL